MRKNSIKSSAIYRTNDKIENLVVSIKLKKINSLLKIPKFEYTILSNKSQRTSKTPSSNNSRKNSVTTEETADSSEDFETITLRWQEKTFSQYEIEFYKNLENCTTDIHKTYYNLILNKNNDNRGDSLPKIFTYTNDDNFQPKEDFVQIGNRRKLQIDENNIIFWYICADLNPEKILFSFKWHSLEKYLMVYPDFNEFVRNPYFIEIDTDYRHLYCYSGKNISEKRKSSKLIGFDNKFECLKESLCHNININKKLLSLFDVPPKRFIRYSIIFNIKKATEFEYNNLHIRYYIHIPNDVKLENSKEDDLGPNDLSEKYPDFYVGSTHSSKSLNGADWNFGYSFQLNLLLSEFKQYQLHDPNLEQTNRKNSLKVFLEAISIDDWQRERIEGYSYFDFNLNAGRIKYNLSCIRPADNSIFDRLKRFFIGGRKLFDIELFFNSSEFLNRYHTKSIGTGKIFVETYCIAQKNPETLILSKTNESVNKKKKTPNLTLEDIMKSYQVARNRLEATIAPNESNV